ncbi:MAG: barstar family protein [Azonexaceae bacterium]|nr:barstar family protein [Azonexaceae bacterium]
MSDNLLKNASASGVYHLATTQQVTIETAARHANLCVLKADIAKQASTQDVLLQLGTALGFPDWYGANFDALFDCLTDADWHPAKGHVLFINGITRLRASQPADFATLIEVLQAAAEDRRQTNAPFWVLIDAPARGVPTLAEA